MIGNKKKLRFVTRGVWWWRYPENSIQLLYECHRKLKRGIAASVGRDVEIDDDDEKVAAWRLHEEHGIANTLRAFEGFHSAVSITSTSAIRRSMFSVSLAAS